MEQLEERWRAAARAPLHRTPTLTAHGLILGCGAVLLRWPTSASAPAADMDRALALLRLTGLDVSTRIGDSLRKASAAWINGDRCLAHIRVAQLGLGAIEREDAHRLFLGAALLDAGAARHSFARLLDPSASPTNFGKYDPEQPRVPAGSGVESGRWARIAGAIAALAVMAERQAARAAAAAAPSLMEMLGPTALAWLTGAAAEVAAPAILLGSAVIPSPNGGIAADGEMPGLPGVRYHLDRDTGLLRLFETSATGGEDGAKVALTAQLGTDGLYHDVDTGVAIARALGNDVVLVDPDRAAAAGLATLARAQAQTDEPKLCPAPQPDQLGSRKLFDEMYEQYVRDAVNPQRRPQLPPGLTFALLDGTTGRWVHYDDCRESDGAMIDAKGNYADVIADRNGRRWLTVSWQSQASRQLRAAGQRRVEWYFHDPAAAAFAKTLFDKNGFAIGIHVLPHPLGVPKPNPRIR